MLSFSSFRWAIVGATLAASLGWAKLPAACRTCRATCATSVADCTDAAAAACPSTPRSRARKCRRRALHQCRKAIDGCCLRTCREGGEPLCCGAPTTTVTTTTLPGNPCFTDPGDGTIHDSCTGLQWEKKHGAKGAQNPADLHDLNNVYPWSGSCKTTGAFCQPDAAAAATCAAGSDGTTAQPPPGCSECPGGDYDAVGNPTGTGPCIAGGAGSQRAVTIWEWLNAVNAANFAGHSDWRIPSQAGRNACPAGQPNCTTTATPRELETIVRGTPGSCSSPCWYPIFGVPTASEMWSASTSRADSHYAWLINFFTGSNEQTTKEDTAVSVRAVRTEQ